MIIIAIDQLPLLPKLVIAATHISLFLTCGIAAYRFREFPKLLKVLSVYIFLTTANQIISTVLWWNSMNNMPQQHIYTAVGFVLIAWFYLEAFRGFMDKRIFIWMAGLFFCFSIFNTLFIQGILTFNSYSLTVQGVLVTILSLTFYIMFLNETDKNQKGLDVKSLNWINTGLFIYFSATVLLFWNAKPILEVFSYQTSLPTWMLHNFFATILYICLFLGLWKHKRN